MLAIELDTSAEVKYFKTLTRRLNLDEAAVNRIHDQLGVIRIFA
ncbi:MAG: tellurite resistance TerB family protein [Candidatus Competibacteraceae bacterium]|nr:tellurite resistance TerB family protein [Candidatus Competibacteraceae bacterium]